MNNKKAKKVGMHIAAYPNDDNMWEIFRNEWYRAMERFERFEKKKDIKFKLNTFKIESIKEERLPDDSEDVIYFAISMKYEDDEEIQLVRNTGN